MVLPQTKYTANLYLATFKHTPTNVALSRMWHLIMLSWLMLSYSADRICRSVQIRMGLQLWFVRDYTLGIYWDVKSWRWYHSVNVALLNICFKVPCCLIGYESNDLSTNWAYCLKTLDTIGNTIWFLRMWSQLGLWRITPWVEVGCDES